MELSILIPSRNEEFLSETIEDILKNVRADTEIIVVLDGGWPIKPLPINPKVTVIYHSESIGQRASTNEAATLAQGKYLMKVDAHCAFDEGFDRKMIDKMEPDVTMVPTMRNLHVFNWVCKDCGWTRYQGPTPDKCAECSSTNVVKDIVWIPKTNPQSNSYCFDATPHFQYFKEWEKRKENRNKELLETMSLQGSCFMLTREKYFELDICGEEFGSWGSQGIEVACKTWLSGGRVLVNKTTWYAHMFRTQGGDFGFPYPLSSNQVNHAKSLAKSLFFEYKWSRQVKPLSWLVEKFWPVQGWTQEDLDNLKEKELSTITSEMKEKVDMYFAKYIPIRLTKGIIYYTDNRLDKEIMKKCQRQILKANIPVVSCSLLPIDFGKNIVLDKSPSYLTMFEQILVALANSDADIIYFCEHDVLYHPSHFDFIPSSSDTFYYNENVWKVNYETGKAIHYDCKQTSGLVAYRTLLLEHYKKRVELVKINGYSSSMGFEPGTHHRSERVDDYGSVDYASEWPNIDIRHSNNLTSSRWSPEEFRNPVKNWIEQDNIPGWGHFRYLWKRV